MSFIPRILSANYAENPFGTHFVCCIIYLSSRSQNTVHTDSGEMEELESKLRKHCEHK